MTHEQQRRVAIIPHHPCSPSSLKSHEPLWGHSEKKLSLVGRKSELVLNPPVRSLSLCRRVPAVISTTPPIPSSFLNHCNGLVFSSSLVLTNDQAALTLMCTVTVHSNFTLDTCVVGKQLPRYFLVFIRYFALQRLSHQALRKEAFWQNVHSSTTVQSSL